MKRRLGVALLAATLSVMSIIPARADSFDTGTARLRGGWEIGFSSLLRPSVSWSSHSSGVLGRYVGAGASALVVPFPVDLSGSDSERLISCLLFHPELSCFAGVRASLFDVVDLRLEVDAGGDVLLQWAGLSNPVFHVEISDVAFAVTPWIWLRPSLRLNPGAPFDAAWLKRLSLEVSGVLPLGNPLLLSDRFRWEAALLWRL